MAAVYIAKFVKVAKCPRQLSTYTQRWTICLSNCNHENNHNHATFKKRKKFNIFLPWGLRCCGVGLLLEAPKALFVWIVDAFGAPLLVLGGATGG